MNDHVDPVMRKILNDSFEQFTFVKHVQVRECSQSHCKKVDACIEFQSLGWICQECEDKLNELLEGRKK